MRVFPKVRASCSHGALWPDPPARRLPASSVVSESGPSTTGTACDDPNRTARRVRGHRQELRWPGHGGPGVEPDRAPGRVPEPVGPVRVWEDDLSDDACRVRDAHGGGHPHRWPLRARAATPQAGHRHGLSGLRALPPHDRRGQPGLPAGRAWHRGRPAAGNGWPGAPAGPAGGLREAAAGAALGRTAAAGGDCARPGVRAGARADGRAARRSRPLSAGGDAVRDPAHSPHARGDHRVCDPRPAGGHGHVGPHRGAARRRGGAGRPAGKPSTRSRSAPSSRASSARTIACTDASPRFAGTCAT